MPPAALTTQPQQQATPVVDVTKMPDLTILPTDKFTSTPFEHAVFRPYRASAYKRVRDSTRSYHAGTELERTKWLKESLVTPNLSTVLRTGGATVIDVFMRAGDKGDRHRLRQNMPAPKDQGGAEQPGRNGRRALDFAVTVTFSMLNAISLKALEVASPNFSASSVRAPCPTG